MSDDEIVTVFARRGTDALFVTELKHGLAPAWEPRAVDAALERLTRSGDLVVVAKSAPDPHLADADLRIAAPAGAHAQRAIDAVWGEWLREFLASHRCC